MLIINADDYGRSRAETDAALTCFLKGRISSVSAMVFMEDSERAADLARRNKISVGLHLNLNSHLSGIIKSSVVRLHHERLVRFFALGKYAQLFYHPLLGESFKCAYQAQVAEFERLFGEPPTHVDGHQHMHLCLNMRINRVIPAGKKVRRSFSFWPGEKSSMNRLYRRWIDHGLTKRHSVTDSFFSLRQCLETNRLGKVANLARQANVELMTHPKVAVEKNFLLSDYFHQVFEGLRLISYSEF
jgi:predicted glycoside hydrolase/deacetylase ChbG (UPF0249 family)